MEEDGGDGGIPRGMLQGVISVGEFGREVVVTMDVGRSHCRVLTQRVIGSRVPLRSDPGVSLTVDSCWQSRAPWLSDAINLPKDD